MKKIIIGNWKMNPLKKEEAEKIFNEIEDGIKRSENAEVAICPPFIYLHSLKPGKIQLGCQDIFWEEKGAFTGEISASMLDGCKYAILGHSERRGHLNETNEMINKKVKFALKSGLIPILCVGDKNRDSKDDIAEVGVQLREGLAGIDNFDNLIVAYEPVWAISANAGARAAEPKDIKESVEFIKNILAELFGDEKAKTIKILYGGSVDASNAKDIIAESGVDGLLIGKTSLNSEEFIKLINNI